MQNNKTNTRTMIQFALLAAIIVIMTFTPLGYLRLGVLEITFITVPVAIGAIVLGPLGGALLGGLFGLTSFFTCFGTSAFGAMLLSINPIYTFIVCMVPRVLCGWLAGVIFKAFKSKGVVSYGLSALACPVLNTAFFMSGLVLCFYNTEYIQGFVSALGAANPFMFVVLFVGVQGLVEAGVCTVLAGAVSKAVALYLAKQK